MSPDAIYTCVGINGIIFRYDVWYRFHSEHADEDNLVSFLSVHYCNSAYCCVLSMGSVVISDVTSGFFPACRLYDGHRWTGWCDNQWLDDPEVAFGWVQNVLDCWKEVTHATVNA